MHNLAVGIRKWYNTHNYKTECKMDKIDMDTPYKHLLNCRVTLTTERGAKYNGVVSGFRPDKTCLRDITVLTRAGNYKATSKNHEIGLTVPKMLEAMGILGYKMEF